jgi:serine/threonine protein kinase
MATETIGRYEVGESIGRGAMAVVYRAVDPTIGRTVALKTMRFDVHGIEHNEVLSRFRNEARSAGNLIHPNLVTIYDAGEQDGTFYIAMEFVEGNTLQAVLAEQHFLTLDRTVDILTQICAGLDYAHAAGVVHRDIKPANIMVTNSGIVKIMDFGIAKSGSQLTTAGAVLGTPNYISPEMVKGEDVDGRSDLFSVAVILHEMLLGERPFIAPNISTIIYKIVNEPLAPDLETRVHPAVAAILRKALSKHPSDRYQSGADLVDALKSYQAMLMDSTPINVVPGTPVPANRMSNFFVAGSTAVSATPSLKGSATPTPRPLAPLSDAPEVFGSNVPAEFRTISNSSVVPERGASSLPKPIVAKRTQGIAVQAYHPPQVSFTSVPSSPPPVVVHAQPKRSGGRFLVLAVVISVVGTAAFLYRNRPKAPEPIAGLAVQAPDPIAITESEPARAPAETSRIESEAEAKLAAKLAAKRSGALQKPEATRPAPTPDPAAATSDLAISCTPEGATVQIDNLERQEHPPFTAAGLAAGEHILVFTKPGYVSQIRTVELVGGKKASVSVRLKPAPITLESPSYSSSQ